MKTALIESIKQYGDLSFCDFMHKALYSPEGGYYSTHATIIGKQGDFITAPEVTPLFGQTVAQQCQEILCQLGNEACLFEFGAGTGRLCVDIMTTLAKQGNLPKAYYILELSPVLRQQQQALIATELSSEWGRDRVQWLTTWPTRPLVGVMIANEVLDAMPVHRFKQTAEGLLESFITLTERQDFVECFKPCENKKLAAHVQKILPNGIYPYISEANLWLEGWLAQCAQWLQQGVVLIFDYGFPQQEYYHPERSMGTLMCHYQHKAAFDPLIHLGEQDITAHVDFTHVAEAASDVGFHVAGYTNQAAFLLNNGILDRVMTYQTQADAWRIQQAAKQLIQPHEMGELFKVMALTQSYDAPLSGFTWYDKRANL